MMSQEHITTPFLFQDFVPHSCSKHKGSLISRPSPSLINYLITYALMHTVKTRGGEKLGTRGYKDL